MSAILSHAQHAVISSFVDKPLHVDWCSYAAAKYAVEHWHYSHTMPKSRVLYIGVWEYGNFIGVILFSVGSNRYIAMPYRCKPTEVCELTRVALRHHATPVSRLLMIAIKLLRRQSPLLRLIVSYADGQQGHYGGIYQASGWTYVGEHSPIQGIMLNGKCVHPRTVAAKYGTQALPFLRAHVDQNAHYVKGNPKYKYLFVFDKTLLPFIQSLALPFPKCAGSIAGCVSSQTEEDGAAPIPALLNC